MIVRISRRDRPFVQIDKRPLENRELSWQAKGLLAYFMSRPDNWEIRMTEVEAMSTNGKIALQSAMKELAGAGHARLIQRRSDDGKRATGTEWVIFEDPTTGNSDCQESRESGKLTVRKPAPNNKEKKTNTDSETKKDGHSQPVFPLLLNTAAFLKAWEEWTTYKRHRRQSLTPDTMQRQLDKLVAWGEQGAIAAIHRSIEQGWTGLFKPDERREQPTERREAIDVPISTYTNDDTH